MELLGEQLIGAGRQTVWDALNDPEILARCIPGCEEITRLSENQLQVKLMVKMGPVRSRFAGTLTLQDIKAPESCSLVFEGTGAAGFAKGGSTVALTEEGAQTRLNYAAKASIGGKLGQVGGRLIESSARKMADEFFSAFQAALSGNGAGDNAADSAPGNGELQSGRPEADAPEGASVQPAAAGAGAQPAVAAAPAAAHAQSSRPEGSGWRPELYRVFWFALGVFFTLLVSRWLP